MDPETMKLYPTPTASDVEGGISQDVELNNGSFSRKNKKGERWGVKLRDAANYLDKKERAQPKMWSTPTAFDSHNIMKPRKNHPGGGQVPPLCQQVIMSFIVVITIIMTFVQN